MKHYTNEAVDNLILKWREMDGQVFIIEEGCLASVGLAILVNHGYKSIVVKENYLNEWSSCTSVRQYKKLPNKYADLIDNININ